MGVIHILDEVVANQIAAGEVVERPRSVVKELIENALDAGASHIQVAIEQGGLGSIQVTDNGKGMAPEDAVLCLSRYATSKLQSPEDLESLQSFGFRGEALPSIASVSRFSLVTRDSHHSTATCVNSEGGKITSVDEAGAPVGTLVRVKDLFFNVPARRKFLKSDRSETALIENCVRVAALSSENVSFTLTVDGKIILDIRAAPSSAGLEHPRAMERAIQCLGEEVRGVLYPFSAQTELLRLAGYLVAPLVTRRDSKGMFLYINKRPVEDKQLVQAVKVAFRTLLEIGRHPICALHLHIDPQQVDINVHPQKREVRFSDPARVQGHLISLLTEFLRTTPWIAYESPPSPQTSVPVTQKSPQPFLLRDYPVVYKSSFSAPNEPAFLSSYAAPSPIQTPVVEIAFSDFKIIGQVANTFLLLEGPRMLVALDQHAAHERVVFERIKAQLKEGDLPKQALLLPIQIRLDALQITALHEHEALLLHFGFEVSPFGDNHAILKSIPANLSDTDAVQIIRDALAELSEQARTDVLQDWTDKLCAQLACHGSVRKGQSLQKEEIEQLLKDLGSVDYNAHCPHGRPIMKRISLEEMASWFNRHSV